MKSVVLSFPTFAFILGTRAALAAGIGLLVAGRLPLSRRRSIGAALVAIGAATTIPAAMSVARSVRRQRRGSVDRDERLIGAVRLPRKGDDDVL